MSHRRHLRRLPDVTGPGFDVPGIAPFGDGSSATSPNALRFSVMIPTFNCAAYLRQCLESVLRQDPGPDVMEIEVIDDCSTLDDPEAVVRELAPTRVRFSRQEKNVGAVGNFNTCIRRARGELVHILHGDDFVLDGFYAEIDRLAGEVPDAGLYATRVAFVDAAGTQNGTSAPLDAYAGGAARDLATFNAGCPLQFAGTVARRSAYEQSGGFIPALVHTADYEMWMRLTAGHGLAASPTVLAAYRRFEGSDTSRLVRTAENLVDAERTIQIVGARNDGLEMDSVLHLLRKAARRQAERFRLSGDREAERANLEFWRRRATVVERLRRAAGRVVHR